MITDPLFYLLATVAVILLGLSKGGFFGLGVMALPLMSLFVPPLQAAAIILPTVLAQDVLTVWTYRRDWSAWNLKIMLPSMAVGIAVAALFAASLVRRAYPAGDRADRRAVRAAALARHPLRALAPQPSVATGVMFGIDRRRSPPCWPMPAGRPGRCTCCRSGSTSSPMSAPSPCCSPPAT